MLLEQLVFGFQKLLGDCLEGMYLHGSLAFGCYHRGRSDIDFLAAVKTEPEKETKAALLRFLLRLEQEAPIKGLEMSLVLSVHCRKFLYPTPYVLHYSPMHRKACREDLEGYCAKMKGTDKDLAAHFTVTRKHGITLFGMPAASFFQEVPRECYLDSIFYDLENAAEEIRENPYSVILNLCRGAAAAEEGQVLSKEQGGLWGISRLPHKYRDLIQAALLEYRTGEKGRTDQKEQLFFCSYMQERLKPFQIKKKKEQ